MPPMPADHDADGEHELRCERHLHARIVAGVQEVRCHQCSKRRGATVTHRYQQNFALKQGEYQQLIDNAEKGAAAHSGQQRFSGTRTTAKVGR